MTLDEGKLLARSIADISNEQQDIKQNMSPDDSDAQLQVGFSSLLQATASVSVTAKYLAATSFVVDHPVYGYVDSATYAIDGGYSGTTSLLYSTTF